MSKPLTHVSFATPFGDLHVFASVDGVVRASGFGGVGEIAAQLVAPWSELAWKDGKLPIVVAAVENWLRGDGDALASVPVEQEGSEFFQKVWETLRGLPSGEPVSYTELAEAAGSPRAMRAVGTACAGNAIEPFVPCHRVIGADRSLTGFAFGEKLKGQLLELERTRRSEIPQTV